MTTQKPGIAASPPQPEAVADFLRAHPHFLSERPELLTTLTIPHETGTGVSSLIERQVALLREENRQYRERSDRLQKDCDKQHKLVRQAHDLALKILQSEQAGEAAMLLDNFLKTHYYADRSALFLFLEGNPAFPAGLIQVRGRHDRLRLMLAELFSHGRPLVDSLQAEHLPLLFNHAATDMNATVLVPLGGTGWEGLLAIGCSRHDTYERGVALDLLVFIARITSLRLSYWLQNTP